MSLSFGKCYFLPIFIFTFLWKFETASGIVCYDCNSMFDSRCGHPFDPYTLGTVNCSLRDRPEGMEDLEPTLCRKIKMEVYGTLRYVRSCGYLTEPKHDDGKCQRRVGTQEVVTTYCSCTGDLCNAASAAGPALLAAAVAAAALVGSHV